MKLDEGRHGRRVFVVMAKPYLVPVSAAGEGSRLWPIEWIAWPDNRGLPPTWIDMNAARAGAATLAVPLLAILWGLNWPTVRVLLAWWSVWQMRAIGLGIGALLLFALSRARGQALAVPAPLRGRLMISAMFSIVGFNLCTAFAQLSGSTARATIVTYAMPVWVVLLAWAVVGERPDARRWCSVGLAVIGLALLAAPLWASGASTLGILYALGASLSWAAGTVFLKRHPLSMAPVPATAWQLAFGATVAAIGWAIQGGAPPTAAPPWPEAWFWMALVFHVFGAMALGYLIWFDVVARLPSGVAALGTLLVPVVGVTGAMTLLGERPTVLDLAGLALITAAAAFVLIPGRPTSVG
jgi:drug/metabolite transporter (DMT)-like permease